MNYSLHPGAEEDIADALDFYAQHASPVIAQRFYNEFARAVNLLVESPGLGKPSRKDRRIFPLQVFPYLIVYRELGSEIRVIVVRHQHRKPSYGDARK